MKTHTLKCATDSFRKIASGVKPFTIRKNDRGFESGDFVELFEIAYGPGMMSPPSRTGAMLVCRVTCVESFEQKPGFAVLGLAVLESAGLRGVVGFPEQSAIRDVRVAFARLSELIDQLP